MTNKIIKTLVLDKNVRLFLMDNTKMLQEILDLSEIKDKTCCLTLAKTVSAVSLLSPTLKANQRISATITLTNKKHKIYADTDATGNVRGYVNDVLLKACSTQSENASLQTFIGTKASIRMIKGLEMHSFTGITNMPYQNIDDDFAYYFKQSEQTDTMIQTYIEFDSNSRLIQSYGIYAQSLPGGSEGELEFVHKQFETKDNLVSLLLNMNDVEIEQALNKYFHHSKVMERKTIQFACHCSKEMFYGFLYSLSKKELQKAIESKTSIHTKCHICGRQYVFSPSEIQTLL